MNTSSSATQYGVPGSNQNLENGNHPSNRTQACFKCDEKGDLAHDCVQHATARIIRRISSEHNDATDKRETAQRDRDELQMNADL